jgi:hypothetical protein
MHTFAFMLDPSNPIESILADGPPALEPEEPEDAGNRQRREDPEEREAVRLVQQRELSSCGVMWNRDGERTHDQDERHAKCTHKKSAT